MATDGPANLVSRASLPNAAQRWLERALPRDLDVPSTIQIEQEGSMEIRGQWTPFTAVGTYKASPLSFEWRARLQMIPGVWIVAEDGHRDGQGWGGARLWGIIPMGKRTDPEVLATQLVRNLGELAMLPSFALSDPALAWSEAGEGAFEVRYSVGGQEAVVRFEIDGQGDVVRAFSPSRPYDVPGGYAEASWYYAFSEHRDFGGVWIPAVAVATYEKEDGAWEYLRGWTTAVALGE
jgi:hypothetical protein